VLEPGASAPEIRLPDLDGAEWPLGEALQQGPVVLVFFKISCPTCQFTFPYLQRLADGGVPFVAISQDDTADTREFQQRFGIYIRTLVDVPRLWPASNAYGISSVPSFFAIESDGSITAAFDGFNKAQLERLGERFDVVPFDAGDHVPDLRPG
jgi:peroxiredoxin